MEVIAGADDRLLERIARSRESFETVLLSDIRRQHAIGTLAYRVVTNDFKTLYVETNLLQRVLSGDPERRAYQQR